MNPLDSFTVERLETIASGNLEDLPFLSDFEQRILSDRRELAKIALAAKQAKPVAEVYQPANTGICAALGPSLRLFNIGLPAGTKLYTSPPAPQLPDGWVMVPKELTAEMAQAARDAHEGEAYLPYSIYRAMLAAAPKMEDA